MIFPKTWKHCALAPSHQVSSSSNCDGKFIDENLNDQGNAFAAAYFDLENGSYLADYESVLGSDLPSLYHVPDTWQSFDRLKPTLDGRFSEWRAGGG